MPSTIKFYYTITAKHGVVSLVSKISNGVELDRIIADALNRGFTSAELTITVGLVSDGDSR